MRTTDCSKHGPQGIGLVCQHIAHGVDAGQTVGFFWGDDTDLARPDAWCKACDDALLVSNDDPGWVDDAGFKIVCAACWDEAKRICGGFA